MSVRVCDICRLEFVSPQADPRCGRCRASEQVWRERIAEEVAALAEGRAPFGSYAMAVTDAVETIQGKKRRPTAPPSEAVSYDFGDSSI